MKEDGHDDDTKEPSALSHSPSTPPLSAALGDFTNSLKGLDDGAKEPTNEEDDMDAMLKGMKKKKKSKTPKAEDGEGGDAPAADDGGLDLSLMKKKKKSKKPKEGTEDEFAAKLAALDIEGNEGEAEPAAPVEAAPIDEGDMEKGTGIWQHDSEVKIPYDLLLTRFFTLLAQKNPDHASSGSRSYKIPPPQCLREGNKKTIFANIAEICKRMKRTDEHVTSYLFAELGTSGSVDGSRRLVIKGRFQQKQIENVLRRYISRSRSTATPNPILTVKEWNMSPVKPADRQIPSSTRERTDCTSSPAIHVGLDDQSLPSRPVSQPKSARDVGNKVKGLVGLVVWGSGVSNLWVHGWRCILNLAWIFRPWLAFWCWYSCEKESI